MPYMSSLSRQLKKGQLTEAQKRLPSGKVVTTPMKGTFLTVPVLGWVSMRRDEVPVVMLVLSMLKDNTPRGILHVELPVYEGETDRATLAALKRYGWNGDVWAKGTEVWPTGDPINEQPLVEMLEASNLVSTLVFPPDSLGNACAQEVEVLRARGNFLMPPLPEPDDVSEADVRKLLELCKDFKQFHP